MDFVKRLSLWLGVAALFGVTGCAPVNSVSQSPVAAPPGFAFPQRTGEAAVAGQALWHKDGDDVVTCAGNEVYLFPVSDYAQNQLERLQQGASLDLSRQPGFHKQLCDADGHFAFTALGAGDWYVMSRFVWYAGSEPRGGWLLTTVDLAPGERKEVLVTESNLYPPSGSQAFLEDRRLPPPDYQNPDYPWPGEDQPTASGAPEKPAETPPTDTAVTAAPAAPVAPTAPPPQPANPAVPLGATATIEPPPADVATTPPTPTPFEAAPAQPATLPPSGAMEPGTPPPAAAAMETPLAPVEPAATGESVTPSTVTQPEPTKSEAVPAPLPTASLEPAPAPASPTATGEPAKTQIAPAETGAPAANLPASEPVTAPMSAPPSESTAVSPLPAPPATASLAEPAAPEASPAATAQPAISPAATAAPAVPDNDPHSLGAIEAIPSTDPAPAP